MILRNSSNPVKERGLIETCFKHIREDQLHLFWDPKSRAASKPEKLIDGYLQTSRSHFLEKGPRCIAQLLS